MFSFTNGPPPVEKTGIDEFPLLGKTHIETKQSINKKNHKQWILKEMMELNVHINEHFNIKLQMVCYLKDGTN